MSPLPLCSLAVAPANSNSYAAIAAGWAALHPDLASRLERALPLVEGVRQGRFPHVYFVSSASREGKDFIVRVNRNSRTSTCTCEDFTFRGGRCKHVLAAALFDRGRA